MVGYARTAVLLTILMVVFVGVGWMTGGRQGILSAFILACGTNFWVYWNGDRIVLCMCGARRIGSTDLPRLRRSVQELAEFAGLPPPALYVIGEDQPNAFAVGRSPRHASIALNVGLLEFLSEEEVAGVVAHELAHIRNRDTLIMTTAATLAGAVGMLAHFGSLFGGRNGAGRSSLLMLIGTLLLLAVGMLAAMLVQLAVSRSREYEADRVGAEICGDPRVIAAALVRMERCKTGCFNEVAERRPGIAHLFVINPLSGRKIASLFQTHPATKDRVARLLAMTPTQRTPSAVVQRGTSSPAAG